ncbi:MAG: type II toxin-antitoxin system VapC family toxin [Deltaproteobacteria bacterium]|nr:type II toxin-antitoxin system VapC family toxin [Deltaproteobacteria bacterium]
MIALDTNVLVRFLVRDDARQSALAAALIRRALEADGHLFVSDIVLCEMVWVLDAAYRVPRGEISAHLANLLAARHLTFRNPDAARRARDAYEAGKGDFADYLIREHAREAGAEDVATFDKVLLRESGYRLP